MNKLKNWFIKYTKIGCFPQTMEIMELSNGYLIGNVFIVDKEKLAQEITKYITEPFDMRYKAPKYIEDTKNDI